MSEPQTTRLKESLLAELLGDVDRLLDRGDALKQSLVAEIGNTERRLADVTIAAAAKLEGISSADRQKWSKDVTAATRELGHVATALVRRGREAVIMAAAVGVVAGLVGGIAAGVVLKVL